MLYSNPFLPTPRKATGKASAPSTLPPDRPAEVMLSGCEAVAAVSSAVCRCAATAHGIPLYRHIADKGRSKVGFCIIKNDSLRIS